MLILLFLLIFETKARVNPFGPTITNDYAGCIIQLMEENFKNSGLLVFADTDDVSSSVARIRGEILKYIHQSIHYSVQVSSPDSEMIICGDDEDVHALHKSDVFVEAVPPAEYFIIIVDNFKDFTHLMGKLIRSRSWDPSAKFIVLLFNYASSDETNVHFVENILTCLFRYNVINIVVIVPQANKIRNAFVYGWRPYDPPVYCGYRNETAKNRLIKENICEEGKVKYKKDTFVDQTPSNMEGCVLYVLALERQPFVSSDDEDPNIEKLLMTEMSNKFKFKTNYEIINAFRGEREDGQWDGALKELITGRGNVLLGGIFPDFDVHEDFACSEAYLADSYTWVVPKAYASPRWLALIIIFQKVVWISVICAFIVCAFSWSILGQMSNDTKYNKSFGHCFISTWICTLGFGSYFRPTKESLRVFFVFFNLYCILCLTAYQTKLIDVLRNPSFEYQIKTVEELVMSGLKFGGFEELHDLFYNSSNPFDYRLGEQWIDVDDISKAMIDVVVHRNFSLLCSRLELAHLSAKMPELSDSFGNYKYYPFEMNVFTVPMEMVAMKGFPFMDEFSDTLGILKQIGVNDVIKRYFDSYTKRRRAKILHYIEQKKPDIDALTLQHLQGGFLALTLGYIFGTFALLIEIIVSNRYVKSKLSQCKAAFKRD
ncbi:uncharacterized protein LOC135074254 [Ostrinia nubilalis]|uniref:uncharacterized protein LOC135074254 n=1 Tax=Ostrinia nubilalis TaxID=29057 RepID=UPI0030826938